jgi:predicted Zn-dependent protease
MPASKSFRPAALAVALGFAGLAPAAQALNLVLTDVGATPMSSQQFAAFQTAAHYWENRLTDNVTVYISVAFGNLDSNVLASASAAKMTVDYSELRGLLAADAFSATDTSAVSHLQAGSSLNFMATQGDLTTRFDTDDSTNNRQLFVTTANAKALGMSTGNNAASNPDATITFANAFANSFAYSRVNGQVPADKTDFITVAEHEIGHALGFLSGVDGIDNCVGAANACGLEAGANRFENQPWFYTLDLFRYSAAGLLDMRVGRSPYFSVDGGVTSIQPFSTGEDHGNGWQASHFGTDVTTLMRPFVPDGESYDATAADLMALDAIGWNLTAAVPEPETYALLLGGLGVIAWARSRRRTVRD